jgi:hypothetical protein
MMATKLRILMVANRLRSGLLAKGLLGLFGVVAIVAFLLFMFPETVTCEQWMRGKAGVCHAPEEGDTAVVCKADSRDEVDGETPCRQPYGPLFCTDGSCYDTMETCRGYEEARSGSRCRSPNFIFRLLGEIMWAIWKAVP